MIDSYPNSSSRRHAGAEISHDGDSLSDSASGAVLDPDLESILRKDRFSSFVDGKKIVQIIRGLQEKAPAGFHRIYRPSEASPG